MDSDERGGAEDLGGIEQRENIKGIYYIMYEKNLTSIRGKDKTSKWITTSKINIWYLLKCGLMLECLLRICKALGFSFSRKTAKIKTTS